MNERELLKKLRGQMDAVSVSPALRRRTLAAAYGKEKTMKKKVSTALICALIGALMCSVALAVASRAGMTDFLKRSVSAYIPENAQDYIRVGEESFDVRVATVTLREIYYDGLTARVTADVTPKEKTTLLTGVDSWPEQSWQDLIRLRGEDCDASDPRTVGDVFMEEGYQAAYNVNLSCDNALWSEICGTSQDYVLGEDGVLTICGDWQFTDDQPEREMTLQLILTRYMGDADGADAKERYRHTLKLTAASREDDGTADIYVSRAPASFASIGVRVERVAIAVKPLELYYAIDYTVTDPELYGQTDDGLWFEFIDPDSAASEPSEQRLSEGLSAWSDVEQPDENGRITQIGTLGINELRDVYTLRAYECWEKQRFDTCEIAVYPATAEEAAQAAGMFREAEAPDGEEGAGEEAGQAQDSDG